MMKSSFILYSELLTGDDLVGCIYFASNECRAQPFVQVAQGERDYYKPTEQDQKEHLQKRRLLPTLSTFVGLPRPFESNRFGKGKGRTLLGIQVATSGGVLYQSYPLVLSLDFDSASLCRGLYI